MHRPADAQHPGSLEDGVLWPPHGGELFFFFCWVTWNGICSAVGLLLAELFPFMHVLVDGDGLVLIGFVFVNGMFRPFFFFFFHSVMCFGVVSSRILAFGVVS